MSYIINLGCWQSVFAVPSEIVDKHLRLANAAHIKVILFILRHSGEALDALVISDAVGLSESDVSDALAYWEACGLIALNDAGELAPPAFEPSVISDITVPSAPSDEPEIKTEITDDAGKSSPAAPSPKRTEKVRYSYEECADKNIITDFYIADLLSAFTPPDDLA